jgi:SSS family solute:Na+ symporter
MFSSLIHADPAHFTMPGATKQLGHAWYISTLLLTSLGFYAWPQAFGSSFTAKSGDTLRRNAVVMPLYSLAVPFVFFTGFAALRISPGLANGDLSLLTVVRKTFPPWFLGVVGGAGALTAMVPSAILTLTAATLFAKNLYRPLCAREMNEAQVARLARRTAIVLMAVALLFALKSSSTIVTLLLLGYAGVTQFFPGIVLGLFWGRANRDGVFWGLVVGIDTVVFLVLTGRDPFLGLNAGFAALALNFAVTFAICLLTGTRHAH